MIRILTLCLVFAMALSQEHHHLKIAEKLAIPHHIRHAYDYPHINLQRPAQPQGPAQPQRFSQPDPVQFRPEPQPFRQQQPESFLRQPEDDRQQPVRQTRFFRMGSNNGPSFS